MGSAADPGALFNGRKRARKEEPMKRRPPDTVSFLVVTALAAAFLMTSAPRAFASPVHTPPPAVQGDPEEYLGTERDFTGTPEIMDDGQTARSQDSSWVPAAAATVSAEGMHPAEAPSMTELSILEGMIRPWMRLLTIPR
jgi:hypothetical protein